MPVEGITLMVLTTKCGNCYFGVLRQIAIFTEMYLQGGPKAVSTYQNKFLKLHSLKKFSKATLPATHN